MKSPKGIRSAAPAHTLRTIHADKNAELPNTIEVMKAGTWPGSAKGNLVITTADLNEFVANFEAGIAQPGQGIGLPIDFSHDEWAEAAGWMKRLFIEGDTLLAEVEWSKAGEEALKGGMFKCISPSFYPACMGMWEDPEDPTNTARNVLVGAGLTNIPFFKDLKAIMASNSTKEARNVMYVSESIKEKEIAPMTLADIRVKASADLTEQEKTFLTEHKDELTTEEKVKFGFEASQKPAEKPVDASQLNGTEGNVVMAAADVKAMRDQITKLQEVADTYTITEATRFVEAHAKRGAIKADQIESWAERVAKDDSVKALLEALPDHPVMASETGKDGEVVSSDDAAAELHTKIVAYQKEQFEKGVDVSYVQASKAVRAANPDLAKKVEANNK